MSKIECTNRTYTIFCELLSQIEQEAESFKKNPYYNDGSPLSSSPQIYLKRGYMAGAVAWAPWKEKYDALKDRYEKLQAAVKEMKDIHKKYHDLNGDNPAANHLINIANEAIAWNEFPNTNKPSLQGDDPDLYTTGADY